MQTHIHRKYTYANTPTLKYAYAPIYTCPRTYTNIHQNTQMHAFKLMQERKYTEHVEFAENNTAHVQRFSFRGK